MPRAYVGLGSNLDDPVAHVTRALDDLNRIPHTHCIARSSLYRSAPLDGSDQPEYVNAVAALDTELPALQLLAQLQHIEHDHGRVRTGEQWGPRTLDLDLLDYNGEQSHRAELDLPHPGAHLRDFVLVPWCEIAPQAAIPGRGAVCELARVCASNGLVAITHVP